MHVTARLTRTISPARQAAFTTLAAVAGGAYASDTLREQTRALSSRDAGLAAQIVFGCLRFEAQLDYLIGLYSGRTASALDEPVRLALRASIYQIRYLERVPAHAAVDESVEYVKSTRRPAVGLTNAVLRKVNRDPVVWPEASVELSCPAWLLTRWAEHFGAAAACKIAAAALAEPCAYIRIRPGDEPAPELKAEQTAVPGVWRLTSPQPPPGIRLHDISSQTVVPLLDLRTTDSYLDLCAAPGNKTVQALEAAPRLAVACDISPRRIAEIPPVCPRVLLDATKPLPFGTAFDRIFIDAPCSGTGTLGRNPEIKWRLQANDLSQFHRKQLAILSQAAAALARGGKILYATCSLESEENEEVIADFLRLFPAFHCASEHWRIPGRDEGDGFYAAVLET